MDAIELLRWQTKTAYEWLELTESDVTAEQALWQPPGTANTIAENYAHTVIWADVDINRYFFARAALLEDGWASRFGLDAFQLDDVPLAVGVDWAALREYGRLVHGWIVQLVEGLTQADLDRSFQMVPVRLGVWKGLELFDLHGQHHVRMHGGEIACLKGLQGGRGYLGGADAPD
jgi:hypothetical protein